MLRLRGGMMHISSGRVDFCTVNSLGDFYHSSVSHRQGVVPRTITVQYVVLSFDSFVLGKL